MVAGVGFEPTTFLGYERRKYRNFNDLDGTIGWV